MSDAYTDALASQLFKETYCPNHDGMWPHECGCEGVRMRNKKLVTPLDGISITDLHQLYLILETYASGGEHWGNKKHFDARNERLEAWLLRTLKGWSKFEESEK